MLSRIKFQIEKLVNEILDQLPSEIWASETTTFFDPAMAGGQFVREIERRLRSAGHSVENISGRVYGCESSLLSVKYAVNKYKLVGTYSAGDFLAQDFGNMKFDVIVGNPPYQDGRKDGGQNKIYNQFSKKSLELLRTDGVMGFVTPTSVLKESKRFSLIGLRGLKLVDFRAKNYFNVGVGICWWLVDNSYCGDVSVYDDSGRSEQAADQVIYDYSTVDKDFSKLYRALKKETDSPDKRMFKQNNFGPALSKSKSKQHIYALHKLHNKKVKLTYWSSRKPYYESSLKLSIAMTKSLTKDACYVGHEDFDLGYMTINIDVPEEAENIQSFIFSEYFMKHCFKWKKLDGYGYNYGLKYLPPFDKSKSWTNDEVKEFLESYVK